MITFTVRLYSRSKKLHKYFNNFIEQSYRFETKKDLIEHLYLQAIQTCSNGASLIIENPTYQPPNVIVIDTYKANKYIEYSFTI